jgi:cytochrome c553
MKYLVRPSQRTVLAVLLAGLSVAAPVLAQVTAPPKAETCVACHGEGGKSTVPMFPVLAGQNARYLYLQMRDFQEGRRKNELMTPQIAGVTRDEMRALADFFAAQKPPQQAFKPDLEKAKLGKAKADETLCTMCHLGEFKGQNDIPRVSGQHYDYVVKQLGDFKARRRTNDAGNMTSVASTLSDTDIDNLAHYIAGL